MPKFKVSWEERRYTFVHADNREKAEELVKNGEFDFNFSDEITSEPEAVEWVNGSENYDYNHQE